MRSTSSLAITTAIALIVACACAGPVDLSGDASTDGPNHFGKFVDAPISTGVPTVCGDARCPEPSTRGPLANVACCLADDTCGIRAGVLSTVCATKHAAGGIDLACPTRSLPGAVTLQGCCRPEGRCGVMDPAGELGCVSEGSDASTCEFHADNDCTSIVELPCDGPEDCAAGQVCCGRAQSDHFDRFGCFASCAGIVDGQSGVWFEICQPGRPCLDPHLECRQAPELPPFLAHCRDPEPPPVAHGDASARDASFDADASHQADGSGADVVEPARRPRPVLGATCGAVHCSPGEKCCLRRRGSPALSMDASEPIDTYCAAADTPCACSPRVDP